MTKNNFITREAELSLIVQYQSGDNSALEELLESHAGYIFQLARRWHSRVKRWFEFEDCFQTAIIGAIIASRKFDCESGIRWTTYATWWMRQTMSRMRTSASVIHIPANKHTDQQAIALWDLLSLDYPVGESQVPMCSLLESVCDQSEVERLKDRQLVYASLDVLPERSREIVLKRLSGKTLLEIAPEYGITKERVRQIESAAQAEMALFIRKQNRDDIPIRDDSLNMTSISKRRT